MTPKMTPEEALFLFNNMEFAEKYQGKDKYTEVTLVIKQALEKQIEKKPISASDNHNHFCSTCHHPIKLSRKYCGSCGQKIGYGSEEQ